MNRNEYDKVSNMTYLEYCDYLQNKYGKGLADYFTKSFVKNPKGTRTKEGLISHHKFEDHAILLSEIDHAKINPFEWQKSENIVYCDYLEHLLLHILICENPAKDKNPQEAVGIGGILKFIVPELNDYYSGWETKLVWKNNCLVRVKEDKDVYLLLIKRIKQNLQNYPLYDDMFLYSSFNEKFGLWSDDKNKALYYEMMKL